MAHSLVSPCQAPTFGVDFQLLVLTKNRDFPMHFRHKGGAVLQGSWKIPGNNLLTPHEDVHSFW